MIFSRLQIVRSTPTDPPLSEAGAYGTGSGEKISGRGEITSRPGIQPHGSYPREVCRTARLTGIIF